jgi:predicted DCC family thiol-disulfide oxidoreductase YuxK
MGKKRSKQSDLGRTDSDARARVLYDGECAMCSNLALRINTTDATKQLATTDLHEAVLPDGITADAVRHELHVIDADGNVARGPDAIFRILQEYPRWRPLARLGRLRPLRPIAALGYRFFAANREYIFGPGARLFWSKQVLLLAMLAAVATAPKLWVSERAYPVVPVAGKLPALLEYTALALLLGASVVGLALPKPRKALMLFAAGAAVLALGDQTRWQPWFYQYALMLGVLAAWRWDGSDVKASLEPLGALRAVLVGIYLWSGIQKLNATFLGGTFGWLLEPLGALLPAGLVAGLSSAGIAAPLIEIAIGLALLFSITRKAAVVAAVVMHTVLLAMLGPWGHDWNSIVWPWNTAMIALVLILFAGDRHSKPASIIGWPISPSRLAMVAAFLVLPSLSLIDRWDPYLSSSLYSRSLRHAGIQLRSDARAALPARLQPYADEEDMLWPMTWALDELNVPAYPALRVYKGLARAVCAELPDPTGLTLGVTTKPDIFTGEISVTDYHCSDL